MQRLLLIAVLLFDMLLPETKKRMSVRSSILLTEEAIMGEDVSHG
jgi:hypothetical protein